MFNKVLNTIKKYNMINMGDKIVVGVSGGADSVALFCILVKLRKEYNISLIVVHVNHGVRGEDAFNDSMYVKSMCEKYDVPFELFECNIKKEATTHKIGEEEAGRLIRYREFNNALKKYGATKIAVAHNLNDSVETVLMRLCRGTGLKGLTGITPVRDNIIRPLIECEREEIEKYLIDNKIEFKNDYTNDEDIYTRNKIRLNVLPLLKEEVNKNVFKNIFNTSMILSEEEKFLQKISEDFFNKNVNIKENKVYFQTKSLKELEIAVLRRVLRLSIKHILGNIKDVSLTNIDDCIKIIKCGKNGKSIDILNGVCVRLIYDKTEIFYKKEVINTPKFCYDINIEKKVYVKECKSFFLLTKNQNYENKKYLSKFDFNKINGDIKLRSRETGDKIYFSSINGNKKIKDFFIDKKIPKEERDRIPLLCLNNDVIFIFKNIYSDYYKVSDNTKEVVYLYVWEEENGR